MDKKNHNLSLKKFHLKNGITISESCLIFSVDTCIYSTVKLNIIKAVIKKELEYIVVNTCTCICVCLKRLQKAFLLLQTYNEAIYRPQHAVGDTHNTFFIEYCLNMQSFKRHRIFSCSPIKTKIEKFIYRLCWDGVFFYKTYNQKALS